MGRVKWYLKQSNTQVRFWRVPLEFQLCHQQSNSTKCALRGCHTQYLPLNSDFAAAHPATKKKKKNMPKTQIFHEFKWEVKNMHSFIPRLCVSSTEGLFRGHTHTPQLCGCDRCKLARVMSYCSLEGEGHWTVSKPQGKEGKCESNNSILIWAREFPVSVAET